MQDRCRIPLSAHSGGWAGGLVGTWVCNQSMSLWSKKKKHPQKLIFILYTSKCTHHKSPPPGTKKKKKIHIKRGDYPS